MFELDVNSTIKPEVIKVIGVGGGGGNAVNRMIGSGSGGVEYIVMNTDAQALRQSEAPMKLQLGPESTRGRGVGGRPEEGKRAAEESKEEIKRILEGSEMVFITAGMGGGTGTGAAPVVAQISKNMGILTVAVVTKPFTLEGTWKMKLANQGIEELRKNVDMLIVIPNDRIFDISEKGTTLSDAFERANQVLKQGVNGITDMVERPGIVNVDFADVRATMENQGVGHLGIGSASGENRAIVAAEEAINSPLLETTVEGAACVLISISATKESLTMQEFHECIGHIQKSVNYADVQTIFGVAEVPELGEEIRVAVVATGFKEGEEYKNKPTSAPGVSVEEPDEEEKEEPVADTEFQIPEWMNFGKKKK